MKQNNKNDNSKVALINTLDNIALNLANLDLSADYNNILGVTIKILKHIEHLAQKLEIPSLRALTHWMLLNTEETDSNSEIIKELCISGSYHRWIEILSLALQNPDKLLLDELQNSLSQPRWSIKPSKILLNDLLEWLKTTSSSDAQESNIAQAEQIKPPEDNSKSVLPDYEEEAHPHIYKEIELDVLQKNYCATPDAGFTKKSKPDTHYQPQNQPQTKQTELQQKHSYYKEIDPENRLPKAQTENENDSQDTANPAFKSNECFGKLSLELDDITMDLFNLSNTSEDVLQDAAIFNNKLEQLALFANSCSYSSLARVTRWCQRNIDLFARNKTAQLYHFVESGESWSWIELVSYCISEPQELSNLSTLTTELRRKEWLEPIAVEDLQGLLLFLKDPKKQTLEDHRKSKEETDTKSDAELYALPEHNEENRHTKESVEDFKTEKEEKNPTTLYEQHEQHEQHEEYAHLSFNWDKDTHPELLAAYFEETPELVSKITDFLRKLPNTQASKEEFQTASRFAHTIKGSSAVLGISALSEFTYKLEKILEYLASKHNSEESLNPLVESADCLDSLFEAIQKQQQAPSCFAQTLEQLTRLEKSLQAAMPEDDSLLELSTPKLPDFIQTSSDDATQNDATQETAQAAQVKNIEEVLETDKAEKPSLQEEKTEKQTGTSVLNKESDKEEFITELEDIVMSLSMSGMKPDSGQIWLDNISAELQRLDLLAEISGFVEVSNISQWCQHNLKLLKTSNNAESQEFLRSGECWSWIELISASLADPEEKSYLAQLSQTLTRPQWLDPISREDLQAILLALNSTSQPAPSPEENPEEKIQSKNTTLQSGKDAEKTSGTDKQNVSAAETHTPPELSFSWDDDIHPELLSIYLQETPEQITEVSQLIYKIAENRANKDDHQHAARIVHTIKGASAVVGITALAEFTHKLEDILEYSVTHQMPSRMNALLLESADCLEDTFESIVNRQPVPAEFQGLLQKLSHFANSLENLDEETESPGSDTLKMPELPDFIKTPDNNPDNNKASTPANTVTPPSTPANTAEAAETHLRVPLSVIDKLLNLAGELVTTTTQISDKLERSIETNKQNRSQDNYVHKMLSELSNTISKQESNQARKYNSLKYSEFDSLEMDTYNELHSIAGLLTESIIDGEEIDRQLGHQLSELKDYARSMGRLNKELSEIILQSRMVSINDLVPRLERIVRQTCRKTGKKAELAVTGNNIHIDTDILNKLSDPLLHLLRNSVDHGIEPPKQRKAKGKYETGRIHLTFARESNHIYMELKDDGAGIDTDKIYQHAVKSGLINPAQEYTKDQILQLILQPGFTTQDKITDISGRGVGMDVVNDAVKKLNGSLEISSQKDQGTTFSIKLPLTLVTSATLLVEISGHPIAIPSDIIDQLFYLSPNQVKEKDGIHYIQHNDNELPIIAAASLLNWAVTPLDYSVTNTLLLIKGKQQLHAVYVDKIIQSREVVIKSLAPWLDSKKGLIGACHLPDGGVAPVINLAQLLTSTYNDTKNKEIFQPAPQQPEDNSNDGIPQVLVVDDSLSNRKALSLTIEQADYQVLTAIDGLDALQIMNENQIDVVFTDLEMPRMNGLELTQAIRAWEAKKHTPVVMITSRTTNKHRQLARKAGVNQYLTKPVITETLLKSLEHWLKEDALMNK